VAAAECCSGVCEYPDPFAEKKNCLPAAPTFACGPSLSCKMGQEFCQVLDGAVVGYQCLALPASCLPPNMADCACMPVAPDCGSCSGPTGQITETRGCG
jgi:hypothetical protein